MNIGISARQLQQPNVESAAGNRINCLAIFTVRLVCQVSFPIVHHTSGHGDADIQNILGYTGFLQTANSAGGQCKVDTSATGIIALTHIGPAFIYMNFVSPSGKKYRQKTA